MFELGAEGPKVVMRCPGAAYRVVYRYMMVYIDHLLLGRL